MIELFSLGAFVLSQFTPWQTDGRTDGQTDRRTPSRSERPAAYCSAVKTASKYNGLPRIAYAWAAIVVRRAVNATTLISYLLGECTPGGRSVVGRLDGAKRVRAGTRGRSAKTQQPQQQQQQQPHPVKPLADDVQWRMMADCLAAVAGSMSSRFDTHAHVLHNTRVNASCFLCNTWPVCHIHILTRTYGGKNRANFVMDIVVNDDVFAVANTCLFVALIATSRIL